jgi:hypothetical protein
MTYIEHNMSDSWEHLDISPKESQINHFVGNFKKIEDTNALIMIENLHEIEMACDEHYHPINTYINDDIIECIKSDNEKEENEENVNNNDNIVMNDNLWGSILNNYFEITKMTILNCVDRTKTCAINYIDKTRENFANIYSNMKQKYNDFRESETTKKFHNKIKENKFTILKVLSLSLLIGTTIYIGYNKYQIMNDKIEKIEKIIFESKALFPKSLIGKKAIYVCNDEIFRLYNQPIIIENIGNSGHILFRDSQNRYGILNPQWNTKCWNEYG